MRNGDVRRRRFLHKGRRPTGFGILIGMLIAALPAGSVSASTRYVAPAVPTASQVPTWPENPDWQRLVPGPLSDDVKPVGDRQDARLGDQPAGSRPAAAARPC